MIVKMNINGSTKRHSLSRVYKWSLPKITSIQKLENKNNNSHLTDLFTTFIRQVNISFKYIFTSDKFTRH